MLKEFQDHLESRLSFLKNRRLLIAISGGIDSVVLTHLCYKYDLNIALAHCNFNLRGKDSDADEDFVLQLAEDLDLEVFIESFDTEGYAEEHKRSIQMAARELRYNWFTELSEQLKFDYVLTAHHTDDNLETFLINFTRGTGLEGLTGIPEVNDIFVRPLLPFSNEQIADYAKVNQIRWRDDSSNKSTKYLRNKLRHDVIPILKEINPSLLQSFQNTLSNLNDTSCIVDGAIESFRKETIDSVTNQDIKYKVEAFKKLKAPKAYLYEVFKEYGFTQWDDILNLLTAQPGKYVASLTHRLIKDRDVLILTSINNDEAVEESITVLDTNSTLKIPCGFLEFSEVDMVSHEHDEHCIYIDKGLLHSPLTIRQKKQGDAFSPLGMKGKKKKLSKFFKDEKFSLVDKENTWLFCSDDNIVWVIGKRADDRFKVTDKTKHILKIELIQ
ncbi:tRNA lysidine(34) synthetase TilS [Aestuariibaculum suncheonense]|uniref:tRNA(Ile)-lysidine synthase n=1 Tax=Aestuariibaculum suncheonense TaxID=1028745 RepID=A0A8J6QFP1_9FLAO|nr:tRNA lysidine(34) synthetase TilS [Aestuariibaculum suncheonense]MBD0835835.1 tRNA lysidine(34) synthetase TilS [Aestuariibaculum suncheonense]